MPEEKLDDAQRTFVVQALACFDTPSEVARSVKEEFGVVVSRQAVQAYDPTKHAGQGLAKPWREMFAATRKAFLEDTATIGIAQRSVRLRMLDRMAAQAEGRGNMALAAQLCEQAAREMGGGFTNKHQHELSGTGGTPLVPTIILAGRPESPPASKAVARVRKQRD